MSNLPYLVSCTRFLLIPVLLISDTDAALRVRSQIRLLKSPPGRSADFPVRSNVERQEDFKRLLEPWQGRGLLRTGKSALGGGAKLRPKKIQLRLRSGSGRDQIT